ncbi:hypothetical protein P8452_53030 [Trifolium repens]|nr:hypothetical protein P8452_53030 [Trifolium repens]
MPSSSSTSAILTHDTTIANNDEATKMINYFHVYTISKLIDFAKPLLQAKIPYNVHILMDREIKERLCLHSRDDFNKLFDRVFDQIVEKELMENTLE